MEKSDKPKKVLYYTPQNAGKFAQSIVEMIARIGAPFKIEVVQLPKSTRAYDCIDEVEKILLELKNRWGHAASHTVSYSYVDRALNNINRYKEENP